MLMLGSNRAKKVDDAGLSGRVVQHVEKLSVLICAVEVWRCFFLYSTFQLCAMVCIGPLSMRAWLMFTVYIESMKSRRATAGRHPWRRTILPSPQPKRKAATSQLFIALISMYLKLTHSHRCEI